MFDYGYKDTAAFLYFQIFFNFFSLYAKIHIYEGFSTLLVSSLFWWCVFRRSWSWSWSWSWSCVLMAIYHNHIHAHIYAHTRTLTGIFRP